LNRFCPSLNDYSQSRSSKLNKGGRDGPEKRKEMKSGKMKASAGDSYRKYNQGPGGPGGPRGPRGGGIDTIMSRGLDESSAFVLDEDGRENLQEKLIHTDFFNGE
jgi:hypothetical protein